MKITSTTLKLNFLLKKIQKFLKDQNYLKLNELIFENIKLFRKNPDYKEKNLYLVVCILDMIKNDYAYEHKHKLIKMFCREIIFSNLFRYTSVDTVIGSNINQINTYFFTEILSTLERLYLSVYYIFSKPKRNNCWSNILTEDWTFEDINYELTYNIVESFSKEIETQTVLQKLFEKYKETSNYESIKNTYSQMVNEYEYKRSQIPPLTKADKIGCLLIILIPLLWIAGSIFFPPTL